ncbi:hypothetical protein ACFVJH_34780 [Streptomyces decoyicus]|uniref:hypothetical protein n=1 Tax=Streptomyces decoyicus TaxID=249567 RepID=UPI00362E0636
MTGLFGLLRFQVAVADLDPGTPVVGVFGEVLRQHSPGLLVAFKIEEGLGLLDGRVQLGHKPLLDLLHAAHIGEADGPGPLHIPGGGTLRIAAAVDGQRRFHETGRHDITDLVLGGLPVEARARGGGGRRGLAGRGVLRRFGHRGRRLAGHRGLRR